MLQIIILSIIVLGVFIFYKYPIKGDTKSLALSAFFIVLTVILKRLSIMIPFFGSDSLKIGFEMIPMMIAGMLLTPSYAFMIGIAVDVLGLLVVPAMTPYPGFTLNSILQAVIPSLLMQTIRIEQQKIVEWISKIGSILLAILAIGYVWQLDVVTISKNDFNVPIVLKIGLTIACLSMVMILWGLFIWKNKKLNQSQQKIFTLWVIGVLIVEILISFFLTPLWLQDIYGIPFMASLFLRVIKGCIMIPLDCILGFTILKALKKF